MTEPVRVHNEGGVLTLTLARPEKKNALTVAMYRTLATALQGANGDPSVRVVLLRSEGDVFTAGNDLKDFMNTPPAGEDSPVFQLLLALVDLEKPLVVAVQGAAVGVGTTALLHADLVYAGARATFKMPFVDLGLCPEGASSFLLPRMMGHAKAAELLMFGDAFDAPTAERLGIVNAVFPDDALQSEAEQRARRLAEKPAASLRATKKLLRDGYRDEVKRALSTEGGSFLQLLVSDEAREAFMAFFEKRKPDFSRFA